MPKRSSNLSQNNHTQRKDRGERSRKCKTKEKKKQLFLYLADGVRGGVVVAWWFAAKPFAMLSFGGVTTYNVSNQITPSIE